MGRHVISLPDSVNDFVDERVAAGSFEDANAYVAELVRRDRENWETAMLELAALMDDARESGVSKRSFREIVDAAREEYERQGRPAAE